MQLMSVHLTGIHLMGVHFIGVYLMGVHYGVVPITRRKGAALPVIFENSFAVLEIFDFG